MPSFNQARYIGAAIRSVTSQSYPHKELILYDGGSKDGSLQIIQANSQKIAKWVSEPDRGQSHALNKALASASGDIIGWLNSDDMYLPGAFGKVAEAFERHPEVVLVHGDRVLIDSSGGVIGWTSLPAFDPKTTGFNVCSETAFWRRSALGDARFTEHLRFAMDLDLFCRLYAVGPFLKLNQYLGAFRCHEESKSSNLAEICIQEARAQWGKIFPDLPDGWKNKIGTPRSALVVRLLANPRVVAFPYFKNRLARALSRLKARSG